MLTNENSVIAFPEMNQLLLPKESSGQSEKHTLLRAIGKGKPLVLILSTDRDTRFLYKTALEMWNFDAAEAENTEQTFRLAETRCPDLVLMDAEIKFVNSLVTMKKLKNFLKSSAFIMLSGHAQENVRQLAIAAGASVFFVKPIDFELLEKSLKYFLKGTPLKPKPGGCQ